MKKLPIIDGILKYLNENNAPFSMPGHKNGRGFLATEEGRILYDHIISGDITEVDGLDNLHKPEGVIKDAAELLKNLYGSKKSYFLVNGSTSGNLAMIFSAFNEGDKVIVERNCHRSIFNAIIMRKLRPVYIKNIINIKYNAPFSIDMEHFLKILGDNQDTKGVIITYPNYYGICSDLDTIIKVAKQKGMTVLVDSAHGAHFGISKILPKSAVELGADMVVMSAHKTLPSLTQTAFLHINENVDVRKVDFYVSVFMSTSPSYMFLSTLDYSRYFLQTYGKGAFEGCIKLADSYRERINKLPGFHIIDAEDLVDEYYRYNNLIDKSRFVINLEKDFSGHKLLEYLREEGIQAEMSDNHNVVLILSPFNTTDDFEVLYTALKKCPMDRLKESYISIIINEIPESILMPYEVMEMSYEEVPIDEAFGKISAQSIVPYPPGIPIIMPGERVDEQVISMVKYYINNEITILGITNEKILVINII